MINNLFDAIKMDLDSYPLKNENELKAYLRYLLGEAYMGKDGNTNTHMYAKSKGISSINSEIQSMVFRGENILNYDQLLNKVTDNIIDRYLKKSMSNNEVRSFKEIMEKMLSYYQEKGEFVPSDINATKHFAEIILNKYFKEKNVRVFSNKDGMRNYVIRHGEKAILEEMKKDLNMLTNVDDLVISLYASFIADSWFSKKINGNDKKMDAPSYDDNGLNTISKMIEKEISNANLNDKQKKWLMDEFLNGNVDSLERYVSKQLIDEYKRLVNNLNQGNYSK